VLFPFLQDTNALDVRSGKYNAVKHDIFIVGPDGTVRTELRNFAIDPTSPAGADTFKQALIAAMP